jgi:glutamate dehydrogenase
MSSHTVLDLVDLIARLAKEKAPQGQGELVHDFVKLFYTNPSKESLTRLPQDQLVDALLELWTLFHTRPKGKPKFRVYYWTPAPEQALAERLVIDIVNDNMSFQVDSLYGILNRLGLKPRLTFHPLMTVERDKKGSITHLKAPDKSRNAKNVESFIHCEVVDNITPDLVTQLEALIPQLLQDVKWANEDWEAMRKQTLTTIKELETATTVPERTEACRFLRWMEEEHYTFLGYCNYEFIDADPHKLATRVATDIPLGVLRNEDLSRLDVLFEGIAPSEETRAYILDAFPIAINKTSRLSNVHRNVPMDCIGVRRYDAKGNVIGMRLFVGLFTSVAYDSSARDIPLLRTKIAKIIERAGFTFDWHDGKALIHILDSLPRDELFQAPIGVLTHISLEILRLQERQRIAFFMRRDQFNRFLSCLVYVPRERFNSELCEQMGEILARECNGTVDDYKAQFGSLAFARVHYTITSSKGLKKKYDVKHIENVLIEAARTWSDNLKLTLSELYREVQSASLYQRYHRAFDRGYQERYQGREVLDDLLMIEQVYQESPHKVHLYQTPAQARALKLKIYNLGEPLPLSDVLPILENLDLKVISEVPYKVSPTGATQDVWIHDFSLRTGASEGINVSESAPKFEEAFLKVRENRIENDSFNRLILMANLDWWQCNILRAYAKYMRLIGVPLSKAYISQTLVKYPQIVSLLIHLFEKRFDPRNPGASPKSVEQIQTFLDTIENADEDRILRLYLTLIQSTIRTNAFQQALDGSHKDHISFKIFSKELDVLPKPHPLYEIFIYSSSMEAIHLRGGKVARGGIRWSDRQEDFRTEVLGLMKAQTVKNSVIVPVGSKGGFIIKTSLEGKNREEIFQEGVRCYQMMIRGLLDITDNLVDGKIVYPQDVVRWDEDDPYLVVAADKGTASFSDFANAISNEYGFWLGDAFASGGSAGYDHKKMAITARGAWESVKRHFRELGTDIQKETIRVVGIGDMSGDVFGNGMLLSKTLKLVAAFNHMHIFIDPTPDPATSFQERERLFNLPRSTWQDYNPKVLSEGGAIYLRHAKNITVTPEIQDLLGLENPTLKPDELIKMLLMHPVDLVWFGGIGAYVKASTESQSDVDDRANDAVRVNGKEMRAKVIGEGANLGCTQKGRIEFERLARGHLNTDAIDNSAGVACSDREVNLKILFNEIMHRHGLSLTARNKLLEKMTQDVGNLVLRDNYLQPQIISTGFSVKGLDQQIQLIRTLEHEGLLDRSLESLPDDPKLEEYQATQTALTRPEIAILMGHSKISFYDQILQTDLPNDPFFEKHLISYFPSLLQKTYREDILRHPLRREIIATFAVNQLINRSGAGYIIEAMRLTGAPLENVFKAFFTAVEVFDLETVWHAIEKLDNCVEWEAQHTALLDIFKLLRRTVMWLLRHYPMATTITETINVLSIGIESFLANIMDCLDENGKEALLATISEYKDMQLPEELAQRLALLRTAATSPDIILIASETLFTVPEVAELYFKVGDLFHFTSLRETIDSGAFASIWERRLASNLLEDFYNYQNDLVVNLLSYATEFNIRLDDHYETLLNGWITAHSTLIETIEQGLKEAQLSVKPDLTALSVLARDLRLLCGG